TGVRFDNVHFAYGGEEEVLRELDLEVAPGEIVAVCGPTGAGKTSLLNLLPRFYDPTGGRVLVGGVDTRDILIDDLRRDVALVTRARVFVLDDPLSAVDTLTERRLVKGLRPALAGSTVLVATQRLSTVELADRAVVLIDGRIVESGIPSELLRRGGAFAELF